MSNKPNIKPFINSSLNGIHVFQSWLSHKPAFSGTLRSTDINYPLIKKTTVKSPGPGIFAYLQKNKKGGAHKQEEILMAFGVLTTLLLLIYLVVFNALHFVKTGLLPNTVVASPFILSILILYSIYRKKHAEALFIVSWLLPALMVGVSVYDAAINYSKVLLICMLVLIFPGRSKKIRMAGFIYLTLAYAVIQLRYYQTNAVNLISSIFSFDVVMMPVFSLIMFMVLSGIKGEISLYQHEITRQKDALARKNSTLEELVSFNEQQRDKLKRTTLLKEKLISVLSNDVCGPLSAFKSLISNYEKGKLTDKMVADGLLETKKDIAAIDTIIPELFNWSKNDRGNFSQQIVNGTAIAEINASILSLYTLWAKAKGLNITTLVDIPDNMCLSIPQREFEMVTRNLLTNAIKFSNSGGEIAVSLQAKPGICGSVAILSVKDSGIGMPAPFLKRINGNRIISGIGTLDNTGVGVGLSIVFDVIKNYGLQYNIQSEANKGTEFWINIPMVSC